jgi:RHS repeat-associated protein
MDEPLGETEGNSISYLHHDGMGSITALSSPSGTLAGTVAYAPFGEVESSTGRRSVYGFTGRELDPSGLMYFRARHYDPGTGRFLSKDPLLGVLQAPGSLNRYTYARNSPFRFVDPTGKVADVLVWGGGLAELIGAIGLATFLWIVAVVIAVLAIIYCLLSAECRRFVACLGKLIWHAIRCLFLALEVSTVDRFGCLALCSGRAWASYKRCRSGWADDTMPWDAIRVQCRKVPPDPPEPPPDIDDDDGDGLPLPNVA